MMSLLPHSIDGLGYADRPDYAAIERHLLGMLVDTGRQRPVLFDWDLSPMPPPHNKRGKSPRIGPRNKSDKVVSQLPDSRTNRVPLSLPLEDAAVATVDAAATLNVGNKNTAPEQAVVETTVSGAADAVKPSSPPVAIYESNKFLSPSSPRPSKTPVFSSSRVPCGPEWSPGKDPMMILSLTGPQPHLHSPVAVASLSPQSHEVGVDNVDHTKIGRGRPFSTAAASRSTDQNLALSDSRSAFESLQDRGLTSDRESGGGKLDRGFCVELPSTSVLTPIPGAAEGEAIDIRAPSSHVIGVDALATVVPSPPKAVGSSSLSKNSLSDDEHNIAQIYESDDLEELSGQKAVHLNAVQQSSNSTLSLDDNSDKELNQVRGYAHPDVLGDCSSPYFSKPKTASPISPVLNSQAAKGVEGVMAMAQVVPTLQTSKDEPERVHRLLPVAPSAPPGPRYSRRHRFALVAEPEKTTGVITPKPPPG